MHNHFHPRVLIPALLLIFAGCVMAQAPQSIHPYPLFPFEPEMGYPGMGTPEIQEAYEAWRQAVEAGDDEKAKEILSPFSSDHFRHSYPQLLAYPGSIEHVRVNWQRHVPAYPLYNHHTLVHNLILSEDPATRDQCEIFIEPIYWITQYTNEPIATSATRELEAYPWQPGESLTLTVGPLEPRRMHTVRVIGAIATEEVVRRSFPQWFGQAENHPAEKQLVFRFEINDRPDGGVSTYTLRGRTWDQFYDTVACRFNVYDDRTFTIRITLLEESQATLYTYNIDVHNVFGANAQRAGKQQATTFDVDARQDRWQDRRALLQEMAASDNRAQRDMVGQLHNHYSRLNSDYPDRRDRSLDVLITAMQTPMDPEQRRVRDDNLWHSLPPLNHMLDRFPPRHQWDSPEAHAAAEALLRAGWEPTATNRMTGQWDEPWQLVRRDDDGAIVEVYTWQDMAEGKPLPGTQDRGYGVFLEERLGNRQVLSYLASAHLQRVVHQKRTLDQLVALYDATGDEQVGHDAAMLLARFVYHMPALRGVNYITFTERFSPINRGDMRDDRYGGPISTTDLADYYDLLFDFVADNQALADGLNRFIPWIESPADVRYLFEVYGLQHYAHELTHHRSAVTEGPARRVVRLAVIQNDNDISYPWMDFLFTRSWQYPQAAAGSDDYAVTSLTRSGVQNIGSWSYAIPMGLDLAEMTQAYIALGGDRRFDLSDFQQYSKSLAGALFQLESRVAGGFYPGIGDVGGPARPIGFAMAKLLDNAGQVWRLTGDPRFAWLLVHRVGRTTEDDPQWQAIVDAAATVPINPLLNMPSRVVSDWFAVLEGATGHPDFRFHRAVAVNVGDSGEGHAHHDTLDLRIWALGANMSGDLGQRQGYGRPRHGATFSHNLVEVDGTGAFWTGNPGRWDGYAWVRNLFDAPGAAYLDVEAVPPHNHPNVQLHRRQVALVNVDEGATSDQDPPALDPAVTLPRSYVLDVVRVSGGLRHTYCFHGSVDDNHLSQGGFTINVVNREIVTPGSDTPEGQYLRNFRWSRFAAENLEMDVQEMDREWAADPADDTLIATWRMGPEAYKRSLTRSGADTPGRKYIRMHLLDVGDHRVLHGINTDIHGGNVHNADLKHYAGRMLYVQKDSETPLDSVYVALLEPFADTPTITATRTLAISPNETDANRAVAVEVGTANGHTDLLFQDGRPDRMRQIETAPGQHVSVQGAFAYLSHDAAGLRQVTLTGGQHIKSPDFELQVPQAAYHGIVRAVDYRGRVASVEGFPALKLLEGQTIEIGNEEHRTAYRLDGVRQGADGMTELQLREGLEIMRGTITAADYETGRLTTSVGMRPLRGRDGGLVASNELDVRRPVRLEHGNRYDGFTFEVEDETITAEDFPVGGKFSVWSLGVGDQVTLATGVSLQRQGETDVWQVYANTAFTVNFDGKRLEWSVDGAAWQAVASGAKIGPGHGQPQTFMLRAR